VYIHAAIAGELALKVKYDGSQELELMLMGVKPLSMFYDDADKERDERIVPEELFDRHVS
jgi:hypothetical protein